MSGLWSWLTLRTALTKRTGREDRHMPGPGEPSARQDAPIIGRHAALALVRGLVDPVPQSGQVLLVTGEAGMGKTVLLADAAERARSSGTRVLSVTGRESESRLAFAGLLLDGQPRPPRGQARLQVLGQAAGNPMALIELATVIADDPADSRRWAAEPLPLTDRLSAVIKGRFAALPDQAKAALLLAAVADGPDLRVAASHGAGPDARVLAP